MTLISEEEKQAVIRDARKFVDATFRAAEEVEDEVRSFAQDRARQARPYGLHTAVILPFRRRVRP
jgi:hypothetical protein